MQKQSRLANIILKFKALIQWFVLLELEEHRHWCPTANDCYHKSCAWYCKGLFCSHIERKPCPNCKQGLVRVCKGKMGEYAPCTCGHGRG